MAFSSSFWSLVLCASILLFAYAAAASGEHALAAEWLTRSGGGRCNGSIGECFSEGEMEMSTESSRRILATTKYISYGALQKNSVPCSRRGASYYNCRPGAQANPYRRGCSAITRCRS